jgi:two-component system, response regulator PdtaR
MNTGGIILGHAKILVVEDERITAEDIKKSLEKAGYTVPAVVASGEDAVSFCEENKPDLVIMDIVLEGEIDGIEAAETIRNKFDIPVIYLTAYSDENTVERAKTSHPSAFILKDPFGFIHKPFEENELYTAIDIILYQTNEEKILRSHDELLISLLKSISDGVIATDSDKRIKFMNTAAEKLTGFEEEKSIGSKLFDVFNVPGLRIDVSNETKLKDIVDGEVVLKSNKDIETPIEGTLTPKKDKYGSNDGVIIIFRPKKI